MRLLYHVSENFEVKDHGKKMMASIDILIEEFSVQRLTQFMIQKISSFKPDEENYNYLFEDKAYIADNFEDILKVGEAELNDSEDLIFITAKSVNSLTQGSVKRKQCEIAKKILRQTDTDASIFVFYDDEGNFRFSFIQTNYIGSNRDYTTFRSYTYYVSKSNSNKAFKTRINCCSFQSLDEILDAFSVET